MTGTVGLLIHLFGGISGWLGITFAVYLGQIRQPPAKWTATLGFYALGVALLLTSTTAVFFAGRWSIVAAIFGAYMLAFFAELLMFAYVMEWETTIVEDVRSYLGDSPRFVRTPKKPADDAVYQTDEADAVTVMVADEQARTHNSTAGADAERAHDGPLSRPARQRGDHRGPHAR